MKFHRLGAIAALLGTASLVGCSSDQNQAKEVKGSSIGFHLLASNGVTLTSANYDLNTQAGADVVDGSVPVPNDDSEISLGIQNLGAGDYSLAFSATGMYQGHAVPCLSTPTTFHLNSNQQLTLPTITLTCTVTNQVDTTSGVDANVTVAVDTITIGSVIETFTYGPRSVKGHNNTAGMCIFPPIALKVASHATPPVAYSWMASPDGTFGGTATDGTYQCVTGGTKTLTLTGVSGGTTSTKTVTVNCDDSICASGAVCGNGTVETGEACDEATARCVNCQIHPVCGDGVKDAPEQCDAVGLPTATCDTNCHSVTPPSCGDGTVNQSTEQCDNGTNNSDTAPNACRTNCTSAHCGDGVADSGEACDNGATNSDTASNACRTNCTAARCGDGVVDNGEQCDAAMLPTTTCDASCHTIAAARHVACVTCISASASDGTSEPYCTGDALCVATQNCVIDAACFSPVPSFCYCGTNDTTACAQPAFMPTGPCHTQITAGENAPANNTEALQQLLDPGSSTGVAMAILNHVFANAPECGSLCF